MVVVFHHMGRPKNRTTAQKLQMMSRLLVAFSGVSGGGSLQTLTAWTALVGAPSVAASAAAAASGDSAGIACVVIERVGESPCC
jgi:hypothetical protein